MLAVVVVRLQVRDDAVRLPRVLEILPLDEEKGAARLELVLADEVDREELLCRVARRPCGVLLRSHRYREVEWREEGGGIEGRKARREGVADARARR